MLLEIRGSPRYAIGAEIMSRPVLVIGNKNYSSWSLRAWLMLKHLGVNFEEVRIPLYTEGYKEKILEYSPSGMVPVYIENGVTVWDTIAIIEYMAEKHPEVWPEDAVSRAYARSICAEMHAGFGAVRNELCENIRAIGRKVEISEEAAREIARIEDIWETCREHHSKEGSWLFGPFTAADAMYAPVVFRFLTYGISVGETARQYIHTVISDNHMKEWIRDSAAEPEFINEEEIGLV